MISLVWVFSSVITAPASISEPVPAVVGTATTGAAHFALERRPAPDEIPQRRCACPTISATDLPASSALPPPMAMTPS